MNHEIEAHFAQYCYLLKSEDDAPGWSFAAEHADNRGIAIQMLSTYLEKLMPIKIIHMTIVVVWNLILKI